MLATEVQDRQGYTNYKKDLCGQMVCLNSARRHGWQGYPRTWLHVRLKPRQPDYKTEVLQLGEGSGSLGLAEVFVLARRQSRYAALPGRDLC